MLLTQLTWINCVPFIIFPELKCYHQRRYIYPLFPFWNLYRYALSSSSLSLLKSSSSPSRHLYLTDLVPVHCAEDLLPSSCKMMIMMILMVMMMVLMLEVVVMLIIEEFPCWVIAFPCQVHKEWSALDITWLLLHSIYTTHKCRANNKSKYRYTQSKYTDYKT